jgi:hypothetical protein
MSKSYYFGVALLNVFILRLMKSEIMDLRGERFKLYSNALQARCPSLDDKITNQTICKLEGESNENTWIAIMALIIPKNLASIEIGI